MKVWILLHHSNHDGSTVCGVFSSKELAQKELDKQTDSEYDFDIVESFLEQWG